MCNEDRVGGRKLRHTRNTIASGNKHQKMYTERMNDDDDDDDDDNRSGVHIFEEKIVFK